MPQPNPDTVRAFFDSYRNAEVITVRDGRVSESQVFFGGRF